MQMLWYTLTILIALPNPLAATSVANRIRLLPLLKPDRRTLQIQDSRSNILTMHSSISLLLGHIPMHGITRYPIEVTDKKGIKVKQNLLVLQ